MPGIRTNAAAEVLGVSPNTLRSWERRYGFPTPKRTPGNHRNYELVELQTLRDALAQTGNISSAIELARQRQSAPASSGGLLAALESFDEDAADRAVEESLALRPLERTVEELLLPAIDELAADPDREAELEFASRWAMGWLHGARRLASTASRPAGILLLDSSHGQEAEAVHAQALDLTLRRAGFRVLMLSNELGDERLERALARPRPDRDRPLRPRRRHRGRRAAGPQDPRGRLRRTALRLPRQRPDRRRRPLGRRDPEPGHRDAQRRPAPPRRPGLRLARALFAISRRRDSGSWSWRWPRPRRSGTCDDLSDREPILPLPAAAGAGCPARRATPSQEHGPPAFAAVGGAEQVPLEPEPKAARPPAGRSAPERPAVVQPRTVPRRDRLADRHR